MGDKQPNTRMEAVLKNFVILVCFIAFLKGLEESVKTYLEEPISTNTVESKMESYTFPSVTACSFSFASFNPSQHYLNYTFQDMRDEKIFSMRSLVQKNVSLLNS